MKASYVPIFGILDHVNVNGEPKNRKNGNFWVEKSINSLITQKPLDVQSWNLDTTWMLIKAYRESSFGVPGLAEALLRMMAPGRDFVVLSIMMCDALFMMSPFMNRHPLWNLCPKVGED